MKNKSKILGITTVLLFIIININYVNAIPRINVIKPSGNTLYIGYQEILWDSESLNTTNYVKIHLYKGILGTADEIDRIILKTANDGIDKSWEIKLDDYKTGNDYLIKIIDEENEIIYGWSEYFTIINDNTPVPLPPLFWGGVTGFIIVAIFILILILRQTREVREGKFKKLLEKIKSLFKSVSNDMDGQFNFYDNYDKPNHIDEEMYNKVYDKVYGENGKNITDEETITDEEDVEGFVKNDHPELYDEDGNKNEDYEYEEYEE